jgi:hypothetical protein
MGGTCEPFPAAALRTRHSLTRETPPAAIGALPNPAIVTQARKKGVTMHRCSRIVLIANKSGFGAQGELDIFVSTLTDDEAAQFDRAIVERAFKAIAVDQLGGYWNLQTPEGEMTSATISVADQPRISHF